jgi:hypothetical protein
MRYAASHPVVGAFLRINIRARNGRYVRRTGRRPFNFPEVHEAAETSFRVDAFGLVEPAAQFRGNGN